MAQQIRVGIVGCGNISGIYFKNLTSQWDWVKVEACSDVIAERAQQKAREYNIAKCCTTEELLADRDIDIVLNLTTPPLHANLNLAALSAGKHVYVEKPFGITRAEARKVLDLARRKKLLAGCAPDTFLGAGIQTCRRLVDEGAIGKPVSAMAFMVCHGHESWHPDPEFYYQPGGGPMLDMGPYYLTALVNCIGPIRRVMGSAGKAFAERTITSEKKYGTKIRVRTPTHLAGSVDFHSGAIGTVVMSFDVWRSTLPRIEIHGTDGSLLAPDPNCFGGEVKVFRTGVKDWEAVPLDGVPYAENSRGIGVADMARAIIAKRKHRAAGPLGAHVLDVMLAFEESSKRGTAVKIEQRCERPAALPAGLSQGQAW
jgi:predicted dehydrogenase